MCELSVSGCSVGGGGCCFGWTWLCVECVLLLVVLQVKNTRVFMAHSIPGKSHSGKFARIANNYRKL